MGKEAKCSKHPFSDMVQVDCLTCHGSGEVEWDDDACSIPEMTTCWRCKGTGEADWLECQWCMDDAADAENAELAPRQAGNGK